MKTSDTQVLKDNNYGYSFKVEYDEHFYINDPFSYNDIKCFIIGNNSSLQKKYNMITFNNIPYNMEELNDLFYELKLNKNEKYDHDEHYILSSLFEHFRYTFYSSFDDGNYYYIYDNKIKNYLKEFMNNDLYSWLNNEYYCITYYKNNKEIDNITGFTSEKYAIEYANQEIRSYIKNYEKTLDIIKDKLIEYDTPKYYYMFYKEVGILKDDCYIMLENFKNQQEKLLNDLIESIKFLDVKFINFEKLKQYHNFKFIQKKAYDKLEHQEIKDLFDLAIDY